MEEDSGLDLLQTEGVAVACTAPSLGGLGTRNSLGAEERRALFPEGLRDLLDFFKDGNTEEEPAAATSDASPMALLEAEAAKALGLDRRRCSGLVKRFLGAREDVAAGRRAAEARKADIRRVAGDEGAKATAVETALQRVETLAELDAVDSCVGLVSLGDNEFKRTLDADVRSARQSTKEVVFGVLRTDVLMEELKSWYLLEQSALLHTVALMSRCAEDYDNPAGSAEDWHVFALEFLDENCNHILGKVFGQLHKKGLPSVLEKYLLEILFYMPPVQEMRLLLHMLEPQYRHLSTRTPYICRIIALLSKLREGFKDELRSSLINFNVPVLHLAWAIFSGDDEMFAKHYSAGFEGLIKIRDEKEFAHVLEPLMTAAMDSFSLHEYLETEQDCEYIASLCASGFRGRASACEKFWKRVDHPFRHFLRTLTPFPHAREGLLGALVASESSANYAFTFVKQKVPLHNLALLSNILEFIDADSFAAHTNVMNTLRCIVQESSFRGDPWRARAFLQFAKKFPQQLLTVLANESEQDVAKFFEYCASSKRDLSFALDMLRHLVLQAERESYRSEFDLAFERKGAEVTKEEFHQGLEALGCGDDVSIVRPTKRSKVSVNRAPKTKMFKLLLQGRRNQVKRFISVTIKFAKNLFRAHSSWEFHDMKERIEIGISITNLMRSVVNLPPRMVESRENLFTESSMQDALISNVAMLKGPRPWMSEELVCLSLELLSSILELDTNQCLQKVSLMCKEGLAATVASYIGHPYPQSPIPCPFPISDMSARILEDFMVTLHEASASERKQEVPSMVAILGGTPNFSERFDETIRLHNWSSIQMLTTSLEMEPGLAAMLLHSNSVLDRLLEILAEFSTFDHIYVSVLEFIGVLWHKGHTHVIYRIQERSLDFWKLVSKPLMLELSESDFDVDDLIARAWSLEIMTLEIENFGVRGGFLELLRTLQDTDRDRSWLQQYLFPQTKQLRRASLPSSLEENEFRVWPEKEEYPHGEFLHERRSRRFSRTRWQQLDLEKLDRIFPGNEKLLVAARQRNNFHAMEEAKLVLLRAWKGYMETRCVISWEEQDAPGGLASPAYSAPDPLSTPRLSTRNRTLSTAVSKHWGDMTSYFLVIELATHLRDLNAERFEDEHQERYIAEVAQIFSSMLHFKLFEKGSQPLRDIESLSNDGVIREDSDFRKRKREMRGEKLRVDSSDPDSPGYVQVISWVLECLSKSVKYEDGLAKVVTASLLTGLLMLFEVAGEEDANASEGLALQRLRLHCMFGQILEQCNKAMLDVALALLELTISQLSSSHCTRNLLNLVSNGAIAGLVGLFHKASQETFPMYLEQQQLCAWLQRNQLSDLTVKVLRGQRHTKDAGAFESSLEPLVRLRSLSSKESELEEAFSDEVRPHAGGNEDPTNEKSAEAETENRLMQMAQQLGYKSFTTKAKQKHSRNYREYVGSKTGAYADDSGLAEVSVVHLFLEFGITSVDALSALDHVMLRKMGVYKQIDRRRLVEIVKASGKESKKKEGQEPRFSRELGIMKAKEMREHCRQMQAVLHIFATALNSEADQDVVTPLLAFIRSLCNDPLLQIVAGDKPFSESLDNRENPLTIFLRGYSASAERDGCHVVWCESLRLVAAFARACSSKNIEIVFDFAVAHRGTILSALRAYNMPDCVLTLGILEETVAVTGILSAFGTNTQRWRLRSSIYGPFLGSLWSLLQDLIIGADSQRRGCFLEEFVRTFFSASKAVPKLCIKTRPVTELEKLADQEPVMQALQRRPIQGTPRRELLRTGSVIRDLREEEESKENLSLAQPQSPSSSTAFVSQLADGDISMLHVTIEYRLCRIIQNCLAVLRNPRVVKSSRLLQIDESSNERLPVQYWGNATIPFPIYPEGAEKQSFRGHRGSDPGFYGHLHSARAQGKPSVATVLSLLGYVRYRFHLAASVHKDSSSAQDEDDLRHPASPRWTRMLSFLSTHAMFVLGRSLELGIHERERLRAIGKLSEWSASSVRPGFIRKNTLDDLDSKLQSALERLESCMFKLEMENDGRFLSVLKGWVKSTLTSFEIESRTALAGTGNDSVQQHVVPREEKLYARAIHAPSHALIEIGQPGPDSVVLIWGSGVSEQPSTWAQIFEAEFGIPNARYLISGLFQRDVIVDLDLPSKGMTCWYENGRAADPKDALQRMAQEEAHERPCPLLDLLRSNGGSAVVESTLERARASISEKGKLGFDRVVELFALIALYEENREVILSRVAHTRKLVMDQLSRGLPPRKIVLGGFQQGGAVALITGLLLSLEGNPIVIGGIACINSYLPLAKEVAQSLVHKMKTSQTRVQLPNCLLCHGSANTQFLPQGAILLAEALQLFGANVKLEFAEGLSHREWSFAQLQPLWQLLVDQSQI